MALRLRRGTDAERQLITPAEGELVYTTDTKSVYVGDGATAGGIIITGEFSLGDLTEVDLSTPPTVGQVLKWDGFQFVPSDDIEGGGSVISGDGVIEGSNYRINIVGDDSSLIVNTATNTVTGTFVGDGSQLTNLPLFNNSVFDLNDVFAFTPPDSGDVLQFDGFNFVSRKITQIEGADSTIMLDASTNSFTGTFVGDGSQLTSLPTEVMSVFDLNNVFAVSPPDSGDVLIFDGLNFVPQKITSIEGADSTIMLDASTNSFTGTFVGDGSQLTSLPTEVMSVFDLNNVFAVSPPDSGDVLQFDGTNFVSQKITSIEGADSTIMLDASTNSFTGTFVGDGSQLTNLPLFNNSVFDLNDVFQIGQLEVDDILVWDGFNFVNQQVEDLINLDEISLLNASIIGDDSSIIIDALTNRVYAFQLDTDQVNTTSIHTLKRAGTNGTATYNIEGLEGNAELILRAHRAGVAAGSGYSNSILLGATGSDGTKNTTALYTGESILYLTQDSTGALNIEEKYITYDSTSGIGKLGIGTFTPSEVLDVVGNGVFTGNVEAASFKGSLVADDSTILVDGVNGTIPYPANIGVVWDGLRPETVVDALDRLALYTQDYSVIDPTDWNGTPPTTVIEAIDRLAAVVKILNGGTGA